jgi:hypothetical protein
MNSNFNPIFVVGNSRSGTTLMGRILGNYPQIFTFEELHFFEELWNPSESVENYSLDQGIKLCSRLLNIQRNGYLTQKNSQDFLDESQKIVSNLKPLSPASVFRAFLIYESQLQHKTIPCEQTPLNVLYIKEILQLYPQARFINMIRDPRDILLSQKRRWRRPFLADNIPKKEAIRYWINYHPITISKLWQANVSIIDNFQDNTQVYSLQFEDLLAEPKANMQKICNFLHISFDEALLDIPQIGSSTNPDQPESLGIDTTRAYSWRTGGLTDTEIFFCQKINKILLEKYQYTLEPVKPNFILILMSLILFPIKLTLALMFSLKRIKNLGETIKRRLR